MKFGLTAQRCKKRSKGRRIERPRVLLGPIFANRLSRSRLTQGR
jgi:hypothetical protein